MSGEETFSDIYKVVIIGASNVGKTALVYRYVINELPVSLTSTVGVEFTKRIITQKQSGSRIQLHIWDTAGQEKFKSVTKHYYRGTDICLLTFDLSDQNSFNDLENWVKEIQSYAPESCIVVMIGNKADLDKREVDMEKALNYAKASGFLYFETSAFWDRGLGFSKEGVAAGIEVALDQVLGQINKNLTTKEDVIVIKDVGKETKCEC